MGCAGDATPSKCNHVLLYCLVSAHSTFPKPVHIHERETVLSIGWLLRPRTHQRFGLSQQFAPSKIPLHRPLLSCLLRPDKQAASSTVVSWLLSMLAEWWGVGVGVWQQQQPNRSIGASVDIFTRTHHRENDRSMVVFHAHATPPNHHRLIVMYLSRWC
jgi:hypothetical protein